MSEPAPHSGIATRSDRRRPGYSGPFDLWPEEGPAHVGKQWDRIQRNHDLFDAQCSAALDILRGDCLEGRAGALDTYQGHRSVEWLTAQYHQHVILPHCRDHRPELAERIAQVAQRLYWCRQAGVFGMAGDGIVVAWESKCGMGKLCPDEARAESLRLEEKYAAPIAAHARAGRVYKAWFTLPNYPPGRLREGMRHIFKRFRDRLIRSKRFGVEGALVILEAPLSSGRDWNVHLNVVLLTRGWVSYKALREAWGANVEIRQHSNFSERGLHGLFAEMVKYAVRSVPEKSLDERHDSAAPALVEWTPEEYLEWFEAHHPFRRTRAYGALHGLPAVEKPMPQPTAWLGRIEYKNGSYQVEMRGTNLGELAGHLLAASRSDLDLIRGDKSTTQKRQNGMRGPP